MIFSINNIYLSIEFIEKFCQNFLLVNCTVISKYYISSDKVWHNTDLTAISIDPYITSKPSFLQIRNFWFKPRTLLVGRGSTSFLCCFQIIWILQRLKLLFKLTQNKIIAMQAVSQNMQLVKKLSLKWILWILDD